MTSKPSFLLMISEEVTKDPCMRISGILSNVSRNSALQWRAPTSLFISWDPHHLNIAVWTYIKFNIWCSIIQQPQIQCRDVSRNFSYDEGRQLLSVQFFFITVNLNWKSQRVCYSLIKQYTEVSDNHRGMRKKYAAFTFILYLSLIMKKKVEYKGNVWRIWHPPESVLPVYHGSSSGTLALRWFHKGNIMLIGYRFSCDCLDPAFWFVAPRHHQVNIEVSEEHGALIFTVEQYCSVSQFRWQWCWLNYVNFEGDSELIVTEKESSQI